MGGRRVADGEMLRWRCCLCGVVFAVREVDAGHFFLRDQGVRV
jgi:hypothetical protein